MINQENYLEHKDIEPQPEGSRCILANPQACERYRLILECHWDFVPSNHASKTGWDKNWYLAVECCHDKTLKYIILALGLSGRCGEATVKTIQPPR